LCIRAGEWASQAAEKHACTPERAVADGAEAAWRILSTTKPFRRRQAEFRAARLIPMEHAEAGRRLRKSQLGPASSHAVIDLAAQQCRRWKLLQVTMGLAGIDQHL